MRRGSTRTFRCAETADGAARCLEIPEWMFDRVACCGLTQAESPRVDRAALDRLKALIFVVSGGACVAMLEARRRPLSQEGEADATPGPPSSCPTTRSVRLCDLGWREIEVIDDDLGRSAAGAVTRAGFERMVAEVCLGKVGAVAAREVSRFARNSRDWQQ